MHMQRWLQFLITTLPTLIHAFGDLCWRGDFDAKRCCEEKDPECWDAIFTEARCCPKSDGSAPLVSRGDPSCWLDGYSYDDCCIDTPKVGCWDSEFTPERCCRRLSEAELEKPFNVLQQDMADAFLHTTALATDSALGCIDSPPGLWSSVKSASASFNVSRQYGMPGELPHTEAFEEMVRHALSWLSDLDSWLKATQACPEGCLNLIDLVVAHIEKEFGNAKAKSLYVLHEELLSEWEASRTSQTKVGWTLLYSGFNYVPTLLNLLPRHSCHGTSLRVYIYRLAKFAHMTAPVLTCSQKMSQCAASVHIYRWLESGTCTTSDPETADLFVLPAFEACYNETACGFGKTDEHDTERCFTQDFDPAKDLPYFTRRGGSDHFFIFGCNLLPFTDRIMTRTRQSILVTVESYQAENRAGPNMLAWLSHWKDVLIPGYIPSWRIQAMLAFNRPMIQRSILVAFHGHSGSSKQVGHMYKRSPLADVRETIINYFWNETDASVGPPTRDYFRRMGMSRFCLIPAGLTAWTIHLYESFFFGCVPVILSDEVTVPFQEEIDWHSLSIKVPTSINMAELHAKLKTFSLGRLKHMYTNLREARCWLDYSLGWGSEGADLHGCSPYNGLLLGLQERVRNRPRLYDMKDSWEPPPRT